MMKKLLQIILVFTIFASLQSCAWWKENMMAGTTRIDFGEKYFIVNGITKGDGLKYTQNGFTFHMTNNSYIKTANNADHFIFEQKSGAVRIKHWETGKYLGMIPQGNNMYAIDLFTENQNNSAYLLWTLTDVMGGWVLKNNGTGHYLATKDRKLIPSVRPASYDNQTPSELRWFANKARLK